MGFLRKKNIEEQGESVGINGDAGCHIGNKNRDEEVENTENWNNSAQFEPVSGNNVSETGISNGVKSFHDLKLTFDKYRHGFLGFCVVYAFILNLFMETLARKGVSWAGGFQFLVNSPLVFLYNTLIIFATLTFAALFRRRVFAITIITACWAAIGIANGIILTQRMTPFTVKDLSAITEGATLITNYLSKLQIVLIAVGLILLVIGVVFLFIKGPKKKEPINYRRNVAGFFLMCIIAGAATMGAINSGIVSTFFGNLAYAYRDYGIPYCFISTWVNTGIKKPSDYSAENIHKILSSAGLSERNKDYFRAGDPAKSKKYPNIIYLQLESFVDPELFTNIQCDKDPMPYYRELMKNYSSGILEVPACGAGTANTEFETLTGVSARFFGPGEYPYKSVLTDNTMESTAFDLKTLGFSTHAIHNHRAVFYNRNQVFRNLGFDTFTSVEYMSDVDKTPKNWAKDAVLTGAIMDALKSTDGRDYVHTISVQGHGKYPPEQLIKNPSIQITAAPSEELKWKYEYYVNQIYEMDKFVRDLTAELSKFNEPTVLVMFGDHIPALDITEETYALRDLYQTQYVIWSNFPMEKEDGKLNAYELSSVLFNRLGIHAGNIIRYGQNVDRSKPEYLEGLKALAYDALYGKKYMYGGKNAVTATNMKMGVKPIKIDKIVEAGDKYYIKGENFTEYSKVTLNGTLLKTFYLGPTLLGLVDEVDPGKADQLKVSQIDRNSKEIISTTE